MRCPRCNGTKTILEKTGICHKCNGEKKIPKFFLGGKIEMVDCPKCFGRGYEVMEKECPRCGGIGET